MESPAEKVAEPVVANGGLRVDSQRFGTLDVPADRVFRFATGLVGFPSRKRFVLLDHRPGSPFKWMLSLDDPELAFAVADPLDLVPGYEPPVERAARQLGAEPADVAIFALVTIPKDPTQMTVNLMAPVAVDLKSMTAQQLILDRPDLSPAHAVVPAKDAGPSRAPEP
jgi:flagellar assembly factor FliW